MQLDSQPEEIDNLERKRIQLEVELHALEKEKDKASKARLVEVKKELDDLRDKLQPLTMKYRKEKERIDEIRKLKQRREELQFSLQEAERRMDLARVADLKYGALQEIDAAIAKLESETGENLMLTETVGPEQIAEVVSWWTGIPVTRLGQNDKERLVGLADRLHQRVVGQTEAVNAVAEAVLRSRAGLGRPQQPTGSFLFLEPLWISFVLLSLMNIHAAALLPLTCVHSGRAPWQRGQSTIYGKIKKLEAEVVLYWRRSRRRLHLLPGADQRRQLHASASRAGGREGAIHECPHSSSSRG